VAGKLAFSAPAKWGKSYFAMQFGLALASGWCEFLGWQFGEPRRVLYLQVELFDGMVRQRLDQLLATMPQDMSSERANLNFMIHEVSEVAPNLSTRAGRRMLQAVIDRCEPDVLIIDPLVFTFPELIENASDSMTEALRYLTDLALDNTMAVMLIHHHGKSGKGSRGSSVYEGWPDSDLQASFISEKNHSFSEISLRLRCAENKGPLYWRMPQGEDRWFVPMPEGWKPDQEGGHQKLVVNTQKIAAICASNPDGLGYGKLIDAIRAEFKVGEDKAREIFREAKNALVIKQDGGKGSNWKVAPAMVTSEEDPGVDFHATQDADMGQEDEGEDDNE
jgi:hypothetical protein